MTIIVGQDPDYYRQMSERWGNSLHAMTQIMEQKRAREDRDLARKLELLTNNPDLADTLGSDMIRQYGRKRPEIVSLVSTMQEQKKLRDESERNLSKYERATAKEVGDRARFAKNVEAMPDYIPQPIDMFGNSIPVPNEGKTALRSQMAMLPAPEWSAYQNMSDEDRFAATVAMRRFKMDPPKAPETLGPKDLPEVLRPLIAMGLDPMSEPFRVATESHAGLRVSPEDKEKHEIKLADDKAKQEAAAAALKEKEAMEKRLIKEREESQGRLIRQRETTSGRGGGKKLTPEEKRKQKGDDDTIHAALTERFPGTKERKQITPKDADVQAAKRKGEKPPAEPPPPVPRIYEQTINEMVHQYIDHGADAATASQAVLQAYDLAYQKSGGNPKKAIDALRARVAKDMAMAGAQ